MGKIYMMVPRRTKGSGRSSSQQLRYVVTDERGSGLDPSILCQYTLLLHGMNESHNALLGLHKDIKIIA